MEDYEDEFAALESQYGQQINAATVKIEKHLEVVRKALEEAKKISDETGVPFTINGKTYAPESMTKKFPNVQPYDLAELSGARFWHDPENWGYGWQSSANYC